MFEYTVLMDNDLVEQWEQIRVPVVGIEQLSIGELYAGLAAIERLQRRIEGARSRLMAAIGVDGRDTAAAIARASGRSATAVRAQLRIAKIAAAVPGANDALSNGAISADHLRPLERLENTNAASALLEHAATQTVEEFTRTVERHLADTVPNEVAERQHASRSVKFFAAENGCMGMRAVLPPVEGTELKHRLLQLVDDAYQEAHPERAAKLGDHDVEPMERRLADALVKVVRGEPVSTSARPAMIVTIDAGTLQAELGPGTPIPLQTALGLVDRSDIYAAIRDGTRRANLTFGRNRRLASPLQRLALAVHHHACAHPGCSTPLERCEAHHQVPFEHGGRTDIGNLIPLCSNHHHHAHDEAADQEHHWWDKTG
jgi:hypothetical protein